MNLIDVLKIKYPNANFLSEIQVGDDGTGQRIVMWLLDELEPDQAIIDEWMNDPEVIETHENNERAIYNEPIIKALQELDLRSIRAIRSNDTEQMAELESEAQLLRDQLI